MRVDPYKNLADVLPGALSLLDYYDQKMNARLTSLQHARAAMKQAIADLRARIEPEAADD